MSCYRISQLSERSGVPVTTLRYYEKAGLLPAERSSSGYRVYGDHALERLEFIRTAKRLGLPLSEIAALLAVWEAGACREVKAELRPRLLDRIAEARDRQAELAGFLTTLRTAVAHLDALPDRDGRCDPACDLLQSSTEDPGERWRQAPVACALNADGIDDRVRQWRQVLEHAVHEAIPDGIRLTLPIELAGRVAELAAAEQACCPFFDFHLHLDRPHLHLQVRAPADGQAMLTGLFADLSAGTFAGTSAGTPAGTPAGTADVCPDIR